jgi:hypothetical protein
MRVRPWLPSGRARYEKRHAESNPWSKRAAGLCSACDTRLYHVPGGAPYPNRNLKLGTLDDATWLKPTIHFWTRSAEKWGVIPEDAVRYETQPEALSWVPPTP